VGKGNVRRLASTDVIRREWARHLVGDGLELGPGHTPFPLPTSCARVRYVDRWSPDANRELFPELGDVAFPAPDVVADLDRDGLHAFADAAVDFVVASHVLEHVADPLELLGEIHRVLRVGGTAILLLPDRRATFDAGRPPTSLDHLVAEHGAGVTEVSDEHIVEFVQCVGGQSERPSPDEIEQHRRRSIHVHCWTEGEFTAVIDYSMQHLGHTWQFVDGLRTGDRGSNGIEFGFVLRKVPPDAATAARFDADRRAWAEAAAASRAEVEELATRLAAVEASTSWRVTAPLRHVSAWVRQARRP
jgi:SAM-dependent methyltransferase